MKSLAGGTFGMSVQRPSTVDFRPWYMDRSPDRSLRPKNSGVPVRTQGAG
jgi:hypothetical protein